MDAPNQGLGDGRHGPPEDSGLFCPLCEYNLTGLTSPRCPECGHELDWAAIRRAREREAARTGTCWERWPLVLKPAAFVVTAVQASLLPWQLARRLSARPRPWWPLAFLIICMAGPAMAVDLSGVLRGELLFWHGAVAFHTLVQSLLLGLALPLPPVRHPFAFWFAVTCYTSWPLVPEMLLSISAPIFLGRGSNVWPFSKLSADTPEALTSLIYHLWWLDLICIGMLRLPGSYRWRIILLLPAIPLISMLSGHIGEQLILALN